MCQYTRGHQTIGNSHPNFFQLHRIIIPKSELVFNLFFNYKNCISVTVTVSIGILPIS